jgi:hypothetical protein
METKRNFFDLLALADVERIHSAVIGWLLSDECEALAKEERSAVLNSLFGLPKDRGIYTKAEMRLEWENIDILWITDSESYGKECWVLENKIKSSQHSNQLQKYQGIVKKQFDGVGQHYTYLTVIGEPAKKIQEGSEYHNYTYGCLVKELEAYFSDAQSARNADWIIANEYFKAIQQMTKVTETFLSAPANFRRVFEDGNKGMETKFKGYEGKTLNDDEMYIASRGLETLMQKYYLFDVIKEVVEELNDPRIKSWHVDESRGNADMGFHFENYFGRKNDDHGDHFDIAFQAGTFKFAVSYMYWKPETSQESVKHSFREGWEDIFSALKKEYKCTQINRGKSRSRIAVCYPICIEKEEGKVTKKWYELPRQKFVSILKSEVMKALEMRSKAIRMYEEKIKTKGE